MSFRNKSSFLSLITLFVFVLSIIVVTTPVYADDGTPPQEPPATDLQPGNSPRRMKRRKKRL